MFAETKFFHKAGEGSGGGGGSDPHNLGYYADLTALQTAYPTGTDGDFAILGSTDTIWVWDSGTSAWKDTDTKGQVTSVNGQTGAVTLTIPAAQVNSDWNASSGVAEILNKPTLATVATSGAYSDLTGTPTIPAAPVVPATMPTLAVADWSSNTQTVNVTGVTASNIVFVSPAPASAADYAAAGIVCTAQGSGTLTFTCTTVPSNAITVNVVILG